MRKLFAVMVAGLSGMASLAPHPARCWGDEGHQIIALIAQRYLDPRVRSHVNEMLAADQDTLTARDIASQATWADKHKGPAPDAANGCATCEWHYVNIEIDQPNLDKACFGHPGLAPNTPASRGTANDCIVDKIEQFVGELADPTTPAGERLLALKFVLHLVGDIHQPLHVADNRDAGGNSKRVSAPGWPEASLHFFWDVPFVEKLGTDARLVAARLVANITARQLQLWARGTAAGWAWETFEIGRNHAYGLLPATQEGTVLRLSPRYLRTALDDVALQLSKSGVRLAFTLNCALGATRTALASSNKTQHDRGSKIPFIHSCAHGLISVPR